MSMTPPTFQVLLATEAGRAEHTVQVFTGDQLRAELEAGKLGLPLAFSEAPTHHTALWLWAACRREGITSEGFRAFQDQLLLVARVDEPEGAGVDPTQPDQPPVPG